MICFSFSWKKYTYTSAISAQKRELSLKYTKILWGKNDWIRRFTQNLSIIAKNRDMKTDTQVINFFRSVQHGMNLVKDVTSEMISLLDTETADKVKELISYLIWLKTHKKAFGEIIDKNFYQNLEVDFGSIHWISCIYSLKICRYDFAGVRKRFS